MSASLPYGDYDPADPAAAIPASARRLVDEYLRDPQILAAPDGTYYLTGTTREPRLPRALTWNVGVRLWRSTDLVAWEDLGLVWKLDDGPMWLRRFAIHDENPRWLEPAEFHAADLDPLSEDIRRCVWAPEIHFVPSLGTYVIAASFNVNMGIPLERWLGETFGGTFLLRSTSGRPEGPYEVTSERVLTDLVDISLFVEDDGRVFAIVPSGRSAVLSPQLDGLTQLCGAWQTEYPVRPDYIEGDSVFKRHGRYFRVQAVNGNRRRDGTHTYGNEPGLAERHVSYDLVISSAERLMGRYGPRRTLVVGGGHGFPFCDHDGRWWTTTFCAPGERRPDNVPSGCRPHLVPLRWDGDELTIDPEQ